jgi:hypothetical protein
MDSGSTSAQLMTHTFLRADFPATYLDTVYRKIFGNISDFAYHYLCTGEFDFRVRYLLRFLHEAVKNGRLTFVNEKKSALQSRP